MRTIAKHRRDAACAPLSLWERVRLKSLCAVARRLDDRLAIPATSSNFSIRGDGGDSLLVSRSGLHKRDLTPSSFLRTDLEGRPRLPHAPKPSDETALHALVYRRLPHVGCVLHCHAPELEWLRAPDARIEGHELIKALGATGHEETFVFHVVRNSQDMEALARDMEAGPFSSARVGEVEHAFALERHGIYCYGRDVAQAEARLEALLHLLAHTCEV